MLYSVSDVYCIIMAGRPKTNRFWRINELGLLCYLAFKPINMIDQRWGGRCAMMSLNKKGGKTHTVDDGGVSSGKNAAGPFQLSSRARVSNGNPPTPSVC